MLMMMMMMMMNFMSSLWAATSTAFAMSDKRDCFCFFCAVHTMWLLGWSQNTITLARRMRV